MRKRVSQIVLSTFVLVAVQSGARAAGTYYNGNYNSPQRNYTTTSYANRVQNTNRPTYTQAVVPNTNAVVGTPYQNYTRVVGGQTQLNAPQPSRNAQQNAKPAPKKGFSLGATLGHEFASWGFDMKDAGSKLHYDNIRWNVFDLNAGYKFDGSFPVQIDAGFRYGMQFGDSPMIDDDISNGGYVVTTWVDASNNVIGNQVGHALSIGNSTSGDMMGFNIGFGFTDAFKMGSARITPSVGFRYLKYKLETKEDYGVTVDTGYCVTLDGGEVQCDPILIFADDYNGIQSVIWEGNTYGFWDVPAGYDLVSTGGTYMFKLPSISHSYETTWMGPYLALDLDYDIDQYNMFNARFEFGLPMYTSTGNQPYRTDWQHPKSVEDKGGLGDGWHVGLGANYMTALSNSLFLTLGFTFDYYTVSGADASTYLNGAYYTGVYNEILADYVAAGLTEYDMLNGYTVGSDSYGPDPTAVNIKRLESECPGWVCKTESEIESIYKSMGIRIGLQAQF